MSKIIMYADGACRNNQAKTNYGGWGVVLQQGEHKKELYGGALNTTNNKMELQAVIEGLKAINKHDIPIEVYLDSNYVLQGITSWIHNWKKKNWITSSKKPVENKEQWIELDELRNKFMDIQFFKVKGHSGEELNELADQLANKGADSVQKKEVKDVKVDEKEIPTISFFDKVKLQIDNLEEMYKQYQQGKDISTSVYWQVEYIMELLHAFEGEVGTDKIRNTYDELGGV